MQTSTTQSSLQTSSVIAVPASDPTHRNWEDMTILCIYLCYLQDCFPIFSSFIESDLNPHSLQQIVVHLFYQMHILLIIHTDASWLTCSIFVFLCQLTMLEKEDFKVRQPAVQCENPDELHICGPWIFFLRHHLWPCDTWTNHTHTKHTDKQTPH